MKSSGTNRATLSPTSDADRASEAAALFAWTWDLAIGFAGGLMFRRLLVCVLDVIGWWTGRIVGGASG